LKTTFLDAAGATWVERGLYQLTNARNRTVLGRKTWSSKISPGSHVHISMLIEQSHGKKLTNRCPNSDCSGTLEENIGASEKSWFVKIPFAE